MYYNHRDLTSDVIILLAVGANILLTLNVLHNKYVETHCLLYQCKFIKYSTLHILSKFSTCSDNPFNQ